MDFLFFSSTGWQTMDGAHRPTQFARELLKRGHRVLFIELEESPNKPQDDNLSVVSPFSLGIAEREIKRAWYGRDYGPLNEWRAGVTRALDDFEHSDAHGRVAIWALPFAPLVELAPMLKGRGYYLVYDSLDDFQGLNLVGYHLYFQEIEDYMVKQSDLVLAVLPGLFEKFSAANERTMLLPNGITLGEFPAVPSRPANPTALALGFWGTITDFMIDAPLLEYIAEARPQWQISLIGPFDQDPLAPHIGPHLQAHPNIHLLGRQPHSELAGYLAQFDVCILPAPANQFNRGRDPVKLYEYLAGYRPVVASNMPQLASMPYVYLAHESAEFVALVEKAAATPVDHDVVDRFLSEQTWACRVDALLAGIARNPGRERIAPFVAPPPNKSLAAAEAYIAYLEHTLDERTAQVHRMEALLAEAGIRPALRRGWKRIRDIMRPSLRT